MPEILWTVGTQLSKWRASLKLEALLTNTAKNKDEQAVQRTQKDTIVSGAKETSANTKKQPTNAQQLHHGR